MATSPVKIDIFDNPPEPRGRPRNPLADDYAAALIAAVEGLTGNAVANATGDKPFKDKPSARKRGDMVKRDLARRGCNVTVRIWEASTDAWIVGVKLAPVKSDGESGDE